MDTKDKTKESITEEFLDIASELLIRYPSFIEIILFGEKVNVKIKKKPVSKKS